MKLVSQSARRREEIFGGGENTLSRSGGESTSNEHGTANQRNCRRMATTSAHAIALTLALSRAAREGT